MHGQQLWFLLPASVCPVLHHTLFLFSAFTPYFHLPPVLWQCGGPLLPVLEAGGCCGCLRADPPFYSLADTRVYSVQYREVAGSASLDRVQGRLCPGNAQASTFIVSLEHSETLAPTLF